MSNAFLIIKMCYVHNQWYDISRTTLYIEHPDMYRSIQPRYCSISDAYKAIEFEDGKELEVLFEDSCSAYLINVGFFIFLPWTSVECVTLSSSLWMT